MANPAPHMINAAQGPLSQLRDIHAPAPVGAWPPAPGWFILAALALAAVAGLGWWLLRRWRNNRYRREAMRELHALREAYHEAEDRAAYLADYAALLKRTALTRFPRERVANLTGEAWVDFLDKSAATDEFSMGVGQALIEGNYKPGAGDIDVEALHELGKYWIRRHRRLPVEQAA